MREREREKEENRLADYRNYFNFCCVASSRAIALMNDAMTHADQIRMKKKERKIWTIILFLYWAKVCRIEKAKVSDEFRGFTKITVADS